MAVTVGLEGGVFPARFLNQGDELRDVELAERDGLAGQVAVVGVESLVARIEEVLTGCLAETEIEESAVEPVDDDAHDGAVVPPRTADQLDAVLQAPGGKDVE